MNNGLEVGALNSPVSIQRHTCVCSIQDNIHVNKCKNTVTTLQFHTGYNVFKSTLL